MHILRMLHIQCIQNEYRILWNPLENTRVPPCICNEDFANSYKNHDFQDFCINWKRFACRYKGGPLYFQVNSMNFTWIIFLFCIYCIWCICIICSIYNILIILHICGIQYLWTLLHVGPCSNFVFFLFFLRWGQVCK